MCPRATKMLDSSVCPIIAAFLKTLEKLEILGEKHDISTIKLVSSANDAVPEAWTCPTIVFA